MKKELLEKIGKLHEAEKYQEIIDLIERLPKEQLDRDLIGELGRAYNNIENYKKGLEILKSIESEVGDTALWNWRAGYSYFFLEDYINAKKHFLKAYELDPDDEDVCDFLIGVYLSLAKIEDEKGNSEKALEYALESRKYVKNEQAEVDTESLIAWLYDRYMDYTKAEEILRSILAKNKEDEWVLSELGYCLSEQGKYEEALEYFLMVEKLDEADGWLYQKIAICYKNLDEKEEALKYYLKAVELDEEDTYSISDIAWLYNNLGKHEEALKFLQRLEKIGVDDSWTNTEYAYCLSKLNRYEEAIGKLNHALEVEDEEKETGYIYTQLGLCNRNLEKYEEALEHFERAIELGRNDAWIFEVKGIILLDLGRYEEALDSFRKAYAEDNNGWYLYSMGRCLRGLERYEEAIEVLLESRQISLDEEDVVDGEDFELAYCYIGIGDKDNAQKYLDSARDSVTKRGTLNDYMKEKIEEIEKGILSLDQFLN